MRAGVRATALLSLLSLAIAAWALRGIAQPTAQSFASRVERLSEEGGDFDTDNLISNERSYLEVVPALKAAGVSGGAYIGVGPDQNFSYIAQIRPAIAFIVDIRRDNLLLHLLFKALFASAQNRVEYLSLLTGRPVARPSRDVARREPRTHRRRTSTRARPTPRRRPPPRSPAARHHRRLRRAAHGGRLRTIQRFHHSFVNAGLSLKFESRGRAPRSAYPTLRDLLLATDRAGRSWNYLASEADFQFVRSLADPGPRHPGRRRSRRRRTRSPRSRT